MCKRPPTTSATSLRRRCRSRPATLEALTDGAAAPDGHVLDDGMLVTVQTLREDVTEPPIVLHILIGQGWAVTWHPEPIEFLDEHHERIQDQREVGRLTPVLLLVAMLDWHLDTFYAAAEQLEREVDELDEVALRGDDENMLGRLVDMRRRIARVRRLLSSIETCTPRSGDPISCQTSNREKPRHSPHSPTASNAPPRPSPMPAKC